jgi:hypothetical protein
MTEQKAGWKHKFKILVFSLIPLVVLVLLGQFVASLTIHRSTTEQTDSLTGVTYYTMHVGRLPWSRTTVTALNSLGFPDEEFVNVQPKGDCLHVVFSGDSFTFGDAVDGDSNWVSIVRRRSARQNPGRCIRVFNIAQRMTTIEQQAARIRETRDLLQPDVVVLGQFQNDLTDLTWPGSIAYEPETEGHQTTFWGDLLRQSVPGFNSPLLRMVTYRAFAFLTANNRRLDILSRWSLLADTTNHVMADRLKSIYRGLYSDVLEELRRDGIGFAVVILPSKMDLMAQRYPEGEFFRALAEEFQVPYLDMTPVLSANRKPLPYQMYDGHLNERGNRIVARTVYEWMFEADHGPFPMLRSADTVASDASVPVSDGPGQEPQTGLNRGL